MLHRRPEGRDELREVHGNAHGYHPPIQADTEDVGASRGTLKICACCGKEFYDGGKRQRIYCSYECQRIAGSRRGCKRYHDRKAAANAE